MAEGWATMAPWCSMAAVALSQGGSSTKERGKRKKGGHLDEITIGKERYIVGEALFQPSILGLEEHGIVEQLVCCISSVTYENHWQLLENIVLCGSTTSMTGFELRFQKEAHLCLSAVRPLLVKPPEYMLENLTKNSGWMGGAILAKVAFPHNQHVTKGEYNESGPSIVHKRCF
ncbi:Actin-related protein 7 [Nymphaea thermarum]|nr:Actin-related protein 7 [Nymphaea thermarum]